MSHPFPKPSADDDAWQIGEAHVDGRSLLIRVRPELAAFAGRGSFPQKLMVRWEYGDDGDSGMPTEDQSEDMAFWEDALVPAFEEPRVGILAYVFTYQGRREWHIDFTDLEAMQSARNDALAGMFPMPLSMEASEDPEWSEYATLMTSMSAGEG